MDAISDGAVESVVVMSSSQVGKSEALGNAVGYYIDQNPAPIMVVMPTERDAEAWSKDRSSPMARETPCLMGRIADPNSPDGSNKILYKYFPGGHPTIVGANAPVSGFDRRRCELVERLADRLADLVAAPRNWSLSGNTSNRRQAGEHGDPCGLDGFAKHAG
jgi:phage terminase large subunit GpA-like protein